MTDIFEKQLVGLDFSGTSKIKGLQQSTTNGEPVEHSQLQAAMQERRFYIENIPFGNDETTFS